MRIRFVLTGHVFFSSSLASAARKCFDGIVYCDTVLISRSRRGFLPLPSPVTTEAISLLMTCGFFHRFRVGGVLFFSVGARFGREGPLTACTAGLYVNALNQPVCCCVNG